MQDFKAAQTQKNVKAKNTYGSPQNKFKSAVSPKGSVITNKSPAGAYGIKVGQWKTQKNLNSVNDKSQSSELQSETSIKTMNQQEVKSPKNALKKQKPIPQQKSRLGSPRSTLKSSAIGVASKMEKNEEKSAVEKNCQNCIINEDENRSKIKQLQEKVMSLQNCKNESESEIELLKKQKKQLEEKVQKFSGVLSENRKLIKEKAMRFNNEGEQIKKMNDRILELEETISQMKAQNEAKEREYKEKEDQLTQFCMQNMLNIGQEHAEFPNLLEVQSKVIPFPETQNNAVLQKFMQTLEAKRQQKLQKCQNSSHRASQFCESDIYRALESRDPTEIIDHQKKAHRLPIITQSKASQQNELQKIKKQYSDSLSQIQLQFQKKSHAYQQQIKNKEESIVRLQQQIQQINKNSELSLKRQEELSRTIQELQKENDELKFLKNSSPFKKTSLNSSQTNLTYTSAKDFPGDIFTEDKQRDRMREKKVNGSMIISKLDRIKRISQRQNEIIMQIKQSSKISLRSELSGNRSSISLVGGE